MANQCLKLKPKDSSSSSGSLKLISDQIVEKDLYRQSITKDLFDELIDQDCFQEHSQQIFRTIQELNLSPRSLSIKQCPQQGCKCSKIDCLKMYCQCFSKGRLCNERCECVCCCNKSQCRMQIYKAQQMANFRHPGTFKDIPAFVPLRRCTCKKSECRKNYCECFRAGIKCTQQCQCLDCQNGKPHQHDDYLDSRMQIEVNA